jgi:hypothetical protein
MNACSQSVAKPIAADMLAFHDHASAPKSLQTLTSGTDAIQNSNTIPQVKTAPALLASSAAWPAVSGPSDSQGPGTPVVQTDRSEFLACKPGAQDYHAFECTLP